MSSLEAWKSKLALVKHSFYQFIQCLEHRKFSSSLVEELSIDLHSDRSTRRKKGTSSLHHQPEDDEKMTDQFLSSSSLSGRLSFDQFSQLIKDGECLDVDLSSDLHFLRRSLSLIEEWQSSVMEEIQENLSDSVVDELKNVKDSLMIPNLGSSSGSSVTSTNSLASCYPFLKGLITVSPTTHKQTSSSSSFESFEQFISRIDVFSTESELLPVVSPLSHLLLSVQKVFKIFLEVHRLMSGNGGFPHSFTKERAKNEGEVVFGEGGKKEGSSILWGDVDRHAVSSLYVQLSNLFQQISALAPSASDLSLSSLLNHEDSLLRLCWSSNDVGSKQHVQKKDNNPQQVDELQVISEPIKIMELPEIFLSKEYVVDLFFRDPFPTSAKDVSAVLSSTSVVEKRKKRKSAAISEQDNNDDINNEQRGNDVDTEMDVVETKSTRAGSKKRTVEEIYPGVVSADVVTSTVVSSGSGKKKKGAAAGKKGEKTILPSNEDTGEKLQLEELSTFPIFKDDDHDLTRFLSDSSSYPLLLDFIKDSLSFWIQMNWCFLVRLKEVFLWKMRLEIASSSTSFDKRYSIKQEDEETGEVFEQREYGSNVISLLGMAKKRDIQCGEKEKVENELRSSIEWIEKARRCLGLPSFFQESSSSSSLSVEIQAVLSISSHLRLEEGKGSKKPFSSEPLPSLDELKDFIKTGENKQLFRMVDNLVEVSALKQELKKAKQWKLAFDQLTTIKDDSATKKDGEGITTKMDEINALIAESKELKVNVEEYLDIIHQQTKTYCLCRQIYFGQMIGCDLCEDWYHLACVGLTTAQAEKAEKYICIRCSLKRSISSTANYIGKIANKWMDYQEHFRATDANIQKVSFCLFFSSCLTFHLFSFKKS
jgi:hypothetical protein